MAKSCPNPKHPDFKALVSQYGELNAYKLYYKNNSKIPTAQEAIGWIIDWLDEN